MDSINTAVRSLYIARSVQVVFAENRLRSALLLSLWPLVAGSSVLHVLKIAVQRLLSGPVIIPDKDAL